MKETLARQGTFSKMYLGNDDRRQVLIAWYTNNTRYQMQAAADQAGEEWANKLVQVLRDKGMTEYAAE